MRAGKSHLFGLFRESIVRDGPVICRFDGDLRMRADLDDWLQRQVFMYGVYRVEEKHRAVMLGRLLERGREGGTILDVGAHIGYYTLQFAKRVAAGGRVVAFEPSTASYERLLENIALNDLDNVFAVKAAASDRSGSATINLAAASNTGSTSLHFDSGAFGSERVDTVAIDDYLAGNAIDDVALIKIDVEGHELKVLEGLRRTLAAPAEKAPELFIEVNENTLKIAGTPVEAIFDQLASSGYVAYRVVSRSEVKRERRPFTDSLVYFKKHPS